MNNKPLKKVCTRCLDANQQLQFNNDFFVDVQYGICDCCGNRGIVIPFERFFNINTKLTPHKAVIEESSQAIESETPVSYANDISDLHERINPIVEKLSEVAKELEELRRGKVEGTEIEDVKKSIHSLREYVQTIGEKVANPEPITPKQLQPQPQKQPKVAKAAGDAIYE